MSTVLSQSYFLEGGGATASCELRWDCSQPPLHTQATSHGYFPFSPVPSNDVIFTPMWGVLCGRNGKQSFSCLVYLLPWDGLSHESRQTENGIYSGNVWRRRTDLEFWDIWNGIYFENHWEVLQNGCFFMWCWWTSLPLVPLIAVSEHVNCWGSNALGMYSI